MISKEDRLKIISSELKISLTPEQKDFILNAPEDPSTISRSCAGSGKTTTAILTLHMLIEHFKIKPNRINVMSFSNEATAEIAERYKKTCEQRGISIKPVQFRTLSSMSAKIVATHYSSINLPSISIKGNIEIDEYGDTIRRIIGDELPELTDYDIGIIIKAIRQLDVKFIYNDNEILQNYDFLLANARCGITVKQINRVRETLMRVSKSLGQVYLEHQDMTAYEILLRDKKVSDEYRSAFDIMIVDEVQDMSTLQLLILRKIANKVICIGDINQQIYNFRGASKYTIELLEGMYPGMVHRNLTVSFRCTEQIAQIARKIIEPNRTDGEKITTLKNGMPVVIGQDILKEMKESIIEAYGQTKKALDGIHLVIYRNNYMAEQLVDELYRASIRVRKPKYESILNQFGYKEVFDLIKLVLDPNDVSKFKYAAPFIPDLYKKKVMKDVVMLANKMKLPIHQINYQYNDYPESAALLFQSWDFIRDAVASGKPMIEIYEDLLKILLKSGFEKKLGYRSIAVETLLNTADVVMGKMGYSELITYEEGKKNDILANNAAGIGIRFLTMHSAKGLEAKKVYILGCDDGIHPNARISKSLKSFKCYNQLIDETCNERSLLYVAVTRASDELYIQHSGELTKLITDPYNKDLDFLIYEQPRASISESINGFRNFLGRVIRR